VIEQYWTGGLIRFTKHEGSEAFLLEGYCSRCGQPAREIQWSVKTAARLDKASGDYRLADAEPISYATPIEEAMDYVACGNESWAVDVEARCVCNNFWATQIVAEQSDDDPIVGPEDMPEAKGGRP